MRFFLFLIFPWAAVGELRLNEIQTIGTHNSYHLAPSEKEMKVLGLFSKRATSAWDYSRESLDKQLEAGLRQFELDVFADPKGGLYAAADAPDDDPMREPGMKVLHVPVIDTGSVHPTLSSALKAVKKWSQERPRHIPVMILLELKDRKEMPLGPSPVKFDRVQMEALEKEILGVFQRGDLITPDFVRGDAVTLREQILKKGWPLLNEVRGKVMFCLDNGGVHRETYLKGNPSLRKRICFVSVNSEHPAAAWMKMNDPVGRFAAIQKLVRMGFMVRTRADAETREARTNDRSRANKALASGAQFISTDFPKKVPRISEYEVSLPGQVVARPNPVSAPKGSAAVRE